MSQICTAVSPRPTTLPTVLASGPVRTTASALIVTSTSVRTVTATRSGIVFQTGRPSSTSQIALAARMNAPM
jgi:hypothetical protein